MELRDFCAEDFAAVHAYASDPLVTRWTSWGPNSEAETREFLDRAVRELAEQPRGNFSLAMIDRATGALFGSGGIYRRRGFYREYEMGYVLHRDWWGRGFASEVARALVAFGFGELGAHRIYAQVDPENEASGRVVTRLGFTREGHLRKDMLKHGTWRDSLVFGLLEEEWRPGETSS
jgi:RimJ/RimL family protein N-acetyltransferase